MFRASSRSLWQFASRAPSSRATLLSQSQSFPRSAIVPLLRQQRAVYSSKSDKDDPPPPKQPIDYEAERKRGQELLQSDPSVVSVESSTANTSTAAQGSKSADEDMNSELKHDIGIVKETFTFRDVPRESSMLGLAGTLPYLGTSLSTVFLAWDLNKPIPTGNAFYDAIMIDHETAKYFLSVLEPLQLGYGAVIISFLGAIHWGLEYAEKQPLRERTRFRYGMGVASSVVAWPTLMLPVEYALTSQFMAFVALYFADSRAATRGWAPRWYGAYRFLLTAMVGLAIFISLVGRAKIKQGEALTAHGMTDNFSREGIADHETNWEKLEEEERQRQRKAKKEKEEKEAKEAEKKKKEEAKKGKKKGDKGDKGDDKAKASEEGSDKKSDDKSEAKGKGSESKDEGKNQESKDDDDKESKDEGKESEKSESEDKKSESKNEGKESKGDEKPKEEDSSDKESKDDSSKESKQESDNDDEKDSESKDDKKDEKSKDDKKDDKKDEKSKDDKKDEKSKDDKQESKDKKGGDKKE